jgi:hypothetical protein
MSTLQYKLATMIDVTNNCRVIEASEGGYADARADLEEAYQELDGYLEILQNKYREEALAAQQRKESDDAITSVSRED